MRPLAAVAAIAALAVAGLGPSVLPPAAAQSAGCLSPAPQVAVQEGRCGGVEWQVLRFDLDPGEEIAVTVRLEASSAAHFAYYRSRWSTDLEEGTVPCPQTRYGAPRSPGVAAGAADRSVRTGTDLDPDGLRMLESRTHRQEDEDGSGHHVWVVGAGSDRPFDLHVDVTSEPDDLSVSTGTTGAFLSLADFEDGRVVRTADASEAGVSAGSLAVAQGVHERRALPGSVHGAFGLQGERFSYRIRDADGVRAGAAGASGEADVPLFALDAGAWHFDVDRLVGAPGAAAESGRGELLLLETDTRFRSSIDDRVGFC